MRKILLVGLFLLFFFLFLSITVSAYDIEIQIGHSEDDAFSRKDDVALDTSSNFLRNQYDSAASRYISASHYRNVLIPQGSTIDGAYIRFKTMYYAGTYNYSFSCHDVDDSLDFSNDTTLGSRTQTTAKYWYDDVWATNTVYTKEITDCVQEIVDREGWVSGNDITVIHDHAGGNANRIYIYTWDDTPAVSMELLIDFTEPPPPPNEPPEIEVISPLNNSVDNPILTCMIAVNITDPEGDMFNYSWGCSDGSHNLAIHNTNGTKYLILDECFSHECGTTYSWWINVSDDDNYVNNTYYFTTVDCEVDKVVNVIPENATVDICPCCDSLCFNISSDTVDAMNATVYGSYDGVNYYIWINYTNITSGQYCFCMCCLNNRPMMYNTTYYWYINVSQYGNSSVYNESDMLEFTTAENINNCSGYTLPDTMEISFGVEQFSFILMLILFMFFLWIGYHNDDKRSAGAFLFVAGLMFLGFIAGVFTYMPAIAVLLLFFDIFLMLMGINKWFIKPNMADKDKQKPS